MGFIVSELIRALMYGTGGGGGGGTPPATFALTQSATSLLDFDDAPVPSTSAALTSRYTPIGVTFNPYAGAVSLVSAAGIPGSLPHPADNTSSNGVAYGFNYYFDVDPSLCFDGLHADLSGSGRTGITFTVVGSQVDPETGSDTVQAAFTPGTGTWEWIYDQVVKDTSADIGYITRVYVSSPGSLSLIDNLRFSYSGRYDDVFSDLNLHVGMAYSATVSTGDTDVAPYTATLLSGSLPPGLALSTTASTVSVAGTPSVAGAYSATYRITTSNGLHLDLAITLKVR